MRKEDYKRALDDIKCSDEFKEKMEKMLTVPEGVVPEGYEDSVSSLEIAPKRNWLKIVAAAAAVVLLVGGAGTGAYHYLRNMDEELPPDIIATEPERETYSTPFGDVSRMMLTINGENGFSLTDAPESMVADIAQVLNDNEFVHLEVEKADGQYEEISPLHIDCYGDEQFALWVYPNGLEFYEVGTKNKEPQWYSCEEIYTKIQGAVAKNIIYADLSANEVMYDTDETVNYEMLSDVDLQSLSNDKKQKIRETFEKYADSIEVEYTSEGYPLLSSDIIDVAEAEVTGYSPIVFGNFASLLIDSRYAVKINNNGSFEIFYLNMGGVGYTYVFNAPKELCTEIHDILTDESKTPPPWADVGWDDFTDFSYYHDDCYHTFAVDAENEYRDYLEALDWVAVGEPKDDYHSPTEFDFYIGVGILTIDSDGNAYYDDVNGKDTIYSFGASVYTDLLDMLKRSSGLTFENGGPLPDRVKEHWSQIDGNSECSYVVTENDEEFHINFEMDADTRNRLLEAIEGTEWIESGHLIEDDYIGHRVFAVDGFYFGRLGYVYDYGDGKPFYTENVSAINEIFDILESSLKRNKVAYAQYMLYEPKMQYTSMRCAVLPFGMTYEEASVTVTEPVDLKALILNDLQTINVHSKSCKITEEGEDQTSFALTIELDLTRRWDVEFTIDDYGTPLYYKKTETNNETGEQKEIAGYNVINVEYFHDIES